MDNRVVWSAFEYGYKEKGKDFFLALVIITISIVVASIIYNNYLFAIFIILAAFLITFFNKKKPEIIRFELNEEGLKIKNDLHLYKNFKSFNIDKKPHHHRLLLLSDKTFLPVTIVSLVDAPNGEIEEYLLKHLPKEEIHEPTIQKVIEFFDSYF